MFKRASTGFKYAYTVTFNNCSGLSSDALASIVWKRGAKKENQGETTRKLATEGSVEWDETIAIKCTLFKSKGSGNGGVIKFDEKPIVISVCEYNMKKSKSIPIAKMTVDLSSYAGVKSQTQYHRLKPIKKKGESGSTGETIILSVTYHSESMGEVEGVSETDNIEVNDLDKEDYDGADPFADPDGKDTLQSQTSSSSSSSFSTDKTKGKDKDKEEEDDDDKDKEKSKKHGHNKHKDSDSTELATLNESITTLSKNIENLSEELKAAKAENASLQKQVDSLENAIKENGTDESQQALIESYKEKAAESTAAAQVLRQDNAELKERVDKLEKELKTAKSDSKKSSKKSKLQQQQQKASEEMDAEIASLREQVAALSKLNTMTVTLYECAVASEFGIDGVPRAATKMREWLSQAGALESSSGSALYEPIFKCVQPLYNAIAEKCNIPFYWVSTFYSLLGLVAGSDRLKPRILTQEDSDDGSEVFQKGLVSTIEYEMYESLLAALCCCYKFIDEYVAFSSEVVNGELPKIRTQDIIAAIATSLKAAEEAKLPGSVRVQICEHLVACVDAGIFNELVSKPDLCTCGMGLHIREALGEIDDFLSRDALMFKTKKLLSHVREASCLFIMDKNVLNDDDAINSVICVLNYRQVSRLLENFHEDQFCAKGVDAPILQLMRGRARTSQSADIMLDPHKFFN